MSKMLSNKKTGETCYFSDKFEDQMLELQNCNMHNEVRFYISNHLGMTDYAKKFAKFVNLTYMTMEQMTERYELTQKFLRTITSIYGVEGLRYISKFL